MHIKNKRILVIDDENVIRKAFILALEDTGYQVDTATSGAEGLAMHQRSPYDLILLDLKMPGMDGTEVLRRLRATDRRVPVYIVTTFYEEYFNQLQQLESEDIDFEVMRKPADAEEIALVVESVLGNS